MGLCRAAPPTAPPPETASCSTSQASTAHLIRIGYFTTPFRATRSPKASSSGSTSPASIPRTSAARDIASSTFLPPTDSVIIEALDWLIEQPAPWKVTSRRFPSSKFAETVISSPQSGLFLVHVTAAPGSSRLFRGFL